MKSAFTHCHPIFIVKCFSVYFECTAVQSFELETCLSSQPVVFMDTEYLQAMEYSLPLSVHFHMCLNHSSL